MQYFFEIFIYTIINLASFSAGYRRYYNTPAKDNWEPPGLEPQSVEQGNYSVVSSPLDVGTALHWDATQNVLYYADKTGQMLYRYDPATHVQKSIKFDAPVTLVIPIKGQKHHWVVGLGGEVVILRWYWDSGNFSTSHLFSADPQGPRSTWGIGRADSLGRIWAEASILADRRRGIKSSSNLYVIDTVDNCRVDSELSEADIDVGGGGLTWSLDNKVLYYSSSSRKIEAFDFNMDSGSISNPRTVFDFGDLAGSPAGLTVDKDGNLWVCSYGGSQIIQVNPNNGKLLRRVKLPVKQVTSLAFGGPNLEDLYVTSAKDENSVLDGSVLKVSNLKENGMPMYSADVLCKPCNDKLDDNSANWWCTPGN